MVHKYKLCSDCTHKTSTYVGRGGHFYVRILKWTNFLIGRTSTSAVFKDYKLGVPHFMINAFVQQL